MRRFVRQPGILKPLEPILEDVLRQGGLNQVVLLTQLIRRWQDIAGGPLASVSQPVRLNRQVLFVAVTGAIWLQQFTFFHAQLLQKIHQALHDRSITKLHFMLAAPSRQEARPSVAVALPEPLPLTTEEECQIQKGVADIVDPELREAVRRAWRQGWQAKR